MGCIQITTHLLILFMNPISLRIPSACSSTSLTFDGPPSAACNNTFASMFQDLPTLHNCYIFGNVTTHMSPSDIAFAQRLHYLDAEHGATIQNVGQKLGICLTKYCETLSSFRTTRHSIPWDRNNIRATANAWCIRSALTFRQTSTLMLAVLVLVENSSGGVLWC